MNLSNKKSLVAKTLRVGKGRVVFNIQRLDEIKEAMTKQDVRDLYNSGAIAIAEIKGSRRKEQRTTRRRAGSIKKKVDKSKRTYITLTRKLRRHLKEILLQGKITRSQYWLLRKEIRSRNFRSKAHLKERLAHKE